MVFQPCAEAMLWYYNHVLKPCYGITTVCKCQTSEEFTSIYKPNGVLFDNDLTWNIGLKELSFHK